jgi:hypothetical protein
LPDKALSLPPRNIQVLGDFLVGQGMTFSEKAVEVSA